MQLYFVCGSRVQYAPSTIVCLAGYHNNNVSMLGIE